MGGSPQCTPLKWSTIQNAYAAWEIASTETPCGYNNIREYELI